MNGNTYPFWHIRYTRAMNHLSSAVEEMNQACAEDASNQKFRALLKRMSSVYGAVRKQCESNFKRIQRGGRA